MQNITKFNILDKDEQWMIIQQQMYNMSVCAMTSRMDASSCFVSLDKINHLFKINIKEWSYNSVMVLFNIYLVL